MMRDVRRTGQGFHKGKGMAKRIASAVCVLGVVAVCFGIVGYRNNLKADETYPVMTRGVIDHIEQIPETKRKMYEKSYENEYGSNSEDESEQTDDTKKSTLGTKENPFFILEVVPYEEYGMFGYHIGGCEPVDVKKMQGTADMSTIKEMNTCKVERISKTYFFEDAEELENSYTFDKELIKDTSHQTFYGYYELVEDGKGYFRQNSDGEIEKMNGGNIIWHTIYDYEREQDYSKQKFQEKDEQKDILTTVGGRIYTTRESSEEDPVYSVEGYYYYKNNEDFLKQSLQLTDEEAANYSVIIKTITPKDLNANPDWAKYADLYVVTPTCSYPSAIKFWKEYNWYHHSSPETSYDKNYDTFENRNGKTDHDITWNVAKTMYNKVTADKNYAAIMMTAISYQMTNWKEVTLHIFDWNLKHSGDTFDYNASNNNMYKLTIMLLSMNPNTLKNLYFDKANPLITDDGKFLLQSGEAQDYWNLYTLLPTNAKATDPEVDSNWYGYWNSMDRWEEYQIAGNIEANRRYINGRMFVGGDGGDILQTYLNSNLNLKEDNQQNTKYTNFKDFVNGADSAKPADAVRYILGQQDKGDSKIKGTLNILDIEPCYDSKNGYSLTKNYIFNMMPNFSGKVNITHMTMAEFIGNNEDLNSTYNMIFMGLDDGAYNKDEKGKTIWNDSSMNGKIYFHTGDMAKSAPYWEDNREIDHSVKFLWLGDNYQSATQNQEYPIIRFSGNDLTNLKKTELEKFMKARLPIVADTYLYDTDKLRIDQYSIICNFIKDSKSNGATLYRSENDVTNLEKAVRQAHAEIEWQELPKIYNGKTESETSSTIKNANYLDTNTNGRNLLPFKFKITDSDSSHKYKYRIYIDQNRDGKFEDDEIFYESMQFGASEKTVEKTLKISKLFVGLIQWKIEVYRVGNEEIRYTKTGCSATKNQTGTKIKIKVLQIAPNDSSKQGYLNLDSGKDGNALFKKYYNDLNDYSIEVKKISVGEYEDDFKKASQSDKEKRFSFNESKNINIGGEGTQNPSNYITNWSKDFDLKTELYDSYDMIIIGFGDCYGLDDISNEYGAVDFLKFFAAKGKSILFTHDLTSMNNVKVDGQKLPYGYNANRLLRDLMGMNRYGAVSNQLDASDRIKITDYQDEKRKQNPNFYDTVTDVNGKSLDEKHGFTYYEIKRLGYNKSKTDEPSWNFEGWNWNPAKDKGWKVPYQYMIKDVDGNTVCNSNWQTTNTGFNDNNDETLTASKTNEGQITQYPYKIGTWPKDSSGNDVFDDSKLTVARTHGQYYQLNMEDPEVTVWYCLAADHSQALKELKANDYRVGSSDTYGVSPNDAANNYYIYSKGNIFYSGVGHSTVTGDMEAKLFINTIIGAYRVSYEPPVVEVLNPEAEITDNTNLTYLMTFNQEYDESGNVENLYQTQVDMANVGDGTDTNDKLEKVMFSPVELNAVSTKLSMSAYYLDEKTNERTYITTIYHVRDDGTPEKLTTNAGKNYVFDENINSMDEYYFYYPKACLNEKWTENNGTVHTKPRNVIKFEVKNNKVKESGYTKLNMQMRELFMLD